MTRVLPAAIARLLRRPMPALVTLVFDVTPGRAALVGVGVLARGLVPVAILVLNGALIASVPAAIGGGVHSPAARTMFTTLAALVALYVLQQGSGPVMELMTRVAGNRVDVEVRTRTMAAVQRPAGIAHLEDPAVSDQVQRAEAVGTDWVSPGITLEALAQLLAMRISAFGSAIILWRFAWWAPLLMIAGVRIRYRWSRRDNEVEMRTYESAAADFKKASYLRDLALLPAAGKEIRLFGLAPWLVDGFARQWARAMADTWAARRSGRRQYAAVSLMVLAAQILVLGLIAWRAAHGLVGLGDAIVFTQAAIAMDSFGYTWWNYMVRRGSKLVLNMRSLERLVQEPRYELSGARLPAADTPVEGIRFEDVWFRYPGRDEFVFKGLNLWIPSGKSLALVGENGAGKTTALKLLSRLYDPERGRITVDGLDLRELDPFEWQRRVAAIFQDFVRFELTARENVRLGGIELEGREPELALAAVRAGADGIVDHLPAGWETVLSRQFDDGVELSGGQWQRFALARALYATQGKARVLVLDEPTAQLDVRAEAALYDEFLDLTEGLTTILVSHRYSTVRRAHRICVVEHGELVEQGTHDELMTAGGRYSELFLLQASRFRDDD
jgi:ATP-binding cassette subfamily B protein